MGREKDTINYYSDSINRDIDCHYETFNHHSLINCLKVSDDIWSKKIYYTTYKIKKKIIEKIIILETPLDLIEEDIIGNPSNSQFNFMLNSQVNSENPFQGNIVGFPNFTLHLSSEYNWSSNWFPLQNHPWDKLPGPIGNLVHPWGKIVTFCRFVPDWQSAGER